MKLNPTEHTFEELDDNDTAHVWFADHSRSPMKYFTLCRDLTESGQLAYFERDDQKWGCYGSALNALLTTNSLVISFDSHVAQSLEVGKIFEVSFTLTKDELMTLKRCLISILGSDVVQSDV